MSESSEKLNIGYLGPRGTHSYHALNDFLRPEDSIPYQSFAQIFNAVATGEIQAGFVPIENVIQGPVTEVLDLLLQYKSEISISRSYLAKIEHFLGLLDPSVKFSEIEGVYSHDQILNQCADFIATELSSAKSCAVESSAAAAVRISKAKDSKSAVLASKQTLIDHGFKVSSENVSDIKDNQTRFVLICRTEEISQPGDTKDSQVTSIAIAPGSDRKGLLLELLKIISETHGINLLSIHSRPNLKGGFVFFLDLQGGQSEDGVQKCLQSLEDYCSEQGRSDSGLYIFGSYNRQPYDAALKAK